MADGQPHSNTFPYRETISKSRFNVIAALIPAAAIAAAFAKVRNHGFVWDDGLLSTGSVYRDCDFMAIFTTAANSFEYLPVRDLTLCVDHAVHGTWPGGFHLTNVFLFMLSSLLVGSLYRTLFAASKIRRLEANAPLYALLATLVFALHPLQVEPVAFITARNALLALVFVLATLVVYATFLETSKKRYYILSILFTGLALFSKATALPLAVLVMLLNIYLARDSDLARSAVRAVPHLLVTVLAGILHAVIASSHGAMGSSFTIAELAARLPRAFFIPQFYLYKFVLPASQSVEYVLTGVRDHLLLFATSALLLGLACAVTMIRGFRPRGLSAILCAAYLAALLPILNLLPTHPTVADRYAQIPLVFMVPLLMFPAFAGLQRVVVLWLTIPIIVLLTWLTIRQVPVWESDETLFAHAVAVDSAALESIGNLAHTRWYRGKEAAALEAFALLAEQKPEDAQYSLFQAWHAVHAENYDTAKELLEVAESRGAARYFVHIIRGEMYRQQDLNRGAIREFERARVEAKKHYQRDAHARAYIGIIKKHLRELHGTSRGKRGARRRAARAKGT